MSALVTVLWVGTTIIFILQMRTLRAKATLGDMREQLDLSVLCNLGQPVLTPGFGVTMSGLLHPIQLTSLS